MSSWGRSVGDFVTARVTRLAPAYVLAVLLTTTLLYVWWPEASHPGAVDVLANLTMVQGLLGVPSIDTVYWTLLVEPGATYLFVGGIALYLMYRFGPSLQLWGMLAASWIFFLVRMQERLLEWAEPIEPLSR